MKKIFTTCYLLFTFVITQPTPAQGFDQSAGDPLKMQAVEQARQLATKIGLDEATYVRVKNITLQKLVATKEAEALYARHPEKGQKKLKAIVELYNQQIAAVLSATQHQEYLSLVAAAK